MMSKQFTQLAILGATGSIGDSTLDLVRLHADKFAVYALSGFSQLDKLFALCQEFRPKRVCVADIDKDKFAARLHEAHLDIDVVAGQAGLCELASDTAVDKVVAAIVGAAGLTSTLSAVRAGKTVLLANKESLVMAGDLVMREAKRCHATILPIDSEHNAIFQCLPMTVQAYNERIHEMDFGIESLWLTASGGGFLYASFDEMQNATPSQAIKHPNWSMGQKISIDSATMMNKGLELIEACHLFDLSEDKVKVVIHPQSIVHSMVAYTDGSYLAQLGEPDMRTPIAHALAYPVRIDSGVKPLNLFEMANLEFIKPDTQKFACLNLARHAMQAGNGATIALNAANEIAVSAFLGEQICLTDIAVLVDKVLNDGELTHNFGNRFDELDDIMAFDGRVRTVATALLGSFDT
ncbi:MAG: 1-deoxy-D-xylulose-5-phosphate reductoisomerase [Moraxella sp.]|nr:1-deoxy-D-xylulose-5-phosphate reductoisomerase [Moraxella sp.]